MKFMRTNKYDLEELKDEPTIKFIQFHRPRWKQKGK